MRVSEQWVREWANPAVSSTELAAQLAMAGLEVDTMEPAASPFQRVVVGKVIDLIQHPNADRLRVATVDVGAEQPLQIVCGAPNVAIGMCVPAALVGAVLPGGFTIKKSKLRGVESLGMLCSAKELGLAEQSEGLLPLPETARPGQDVRELLQLDDTVLTVELTPNRGDCLSVAGIAREVAAINRCPFQPVATAPIPPTITDTFPVTVEDKAACPRYVGRVVRGVNPSAETPLWMRERLRRAGLRSLGPLVDVTNYVLLELGQPMHAFDLGQLRGGIVVRPAQAGETITLLNGTTVVLDAGTLLIADAERPLALAGVMGGEGSGCTETTRDVFLESAYFSPERLAGQARRYGLQTDSSYRFERGVDPQLSPKTMERATALLLEIAGGQAGPLVEVSAPDGLRVATPIPLRPERVQAVLGFAIPPEEMHDILVRLGMTVDSGDNGHQAGAWSVIPPSHRFDMAVEADLIEDIIRLYGYHRLPSHQPATSVFTLPPSEQTVPPARFRDVLIARGFQEVITYSFVDPAFQQRLDPERTPLALSNPIAADLSVMRTSLWPGLIKTLVYNQKRQQSPVRLFEQGLTFVPTTEGLQQRPTLAAVVAGTVWPEQWGMPARGVDFFDLKADVEALFDLTGMPEAFTCVAETHPALHPGQSARLYRDGRAIGWIGALHPHVARMLDVEADAFVCEIMTERLRPARLPHGQEISKFPASRRDLALIVDEAVTAEAICACVRQQTDMPLESVRLFDLYRGKGLPEGRKSVGIGLLFQEQAQSLTDVAVDGYVAQVLSALETACGATLRA